MQVVKGKAPMEMAPIPPPKETSYLRSITLGALGGSFCGFVLKNAPALGPISLIGGISLPIIGVLNTPRPTPAALALLTSTVALTAIIFGSLGTAITAAKLTEAYLGTKAIPLAAAASSATISHLSGANKKTTALSALSGAGSAIAGSTLSKTGMVAAGAIVGGASSALIDSLGTTKKATMIATSIAIGAISAAATKAGAFVTAVGCIAGIIANAS